MPNNFKNGLLWSAALLWTESLTGWIWNGVISSAIWHTANAVQYWLSNVWNWNHLLEQWASFIGADAPLAYWASEVLWNIVLPGALGIWSAYAGWKKYQEEWWIQWAISGIEKSALVYGFGWAIGWWIGLLSTPFVAPVLATWLGIYGIKKLAPAIALAANDNVSKINPMNLLKKDKAA